MSIGNFHYENRCVYVTNEDFEFDNVPNIRCHSNIVETNKDFNFFDIVINSGYYEGACIDYESNGHDITEAIGDIAYYSNVKELFNEITDNFDISIYKLRKLCGNIGDMDLDDYFNMVVEKVTEYLKDKEEIEVNKGIDNIKREYGYRELRTIAVFSNGENNV